mmetsp:Transcript_4074/g.12298  ORF Transcript_4074/g.12298 Transcript_4074/m.12298 type:complete len:112 (+) Transcript_4074:246-581(+)
MLGRAAMLAARAPRRPPPAAAARSMGGGGSHPPSPSHVWSPAGGWFPDPPEWKKHTVYAFGALFVGFLWMGRTSVSLEERPVAPKHNIPSAVWASKTVKPVDDKYKTDPHV